MQEKLTEFLTNNRIAVLSVVFPDGTTHSAALHFSFEEESLHIFFQTSSDSKKILETKLMSGVAAQASIVIGFSEKEWLTLQLDGTVHAVLDKEDKERIQSIHYAKYPNTKQYANDPETVLLEFIPSWWRFSDYNTDPPKTFSSEN